MWRGPLAAVAMLAFCSGNEALAQTRQAERLPQDEVVYFVLPDRFENGSTRNDRGGLRGDRLRTGFDPTHKGFYHGGDLAGLISRLDYIQGLGATTIWLAPVYENKPVQGAPGQESAGYHGYWITDFTSIDPHFGTRADFRRFVDAAHARGMRVYMDIITNPTPREFEHNLPFIYARAFLYALDTFDKFLCVLAKEPNVPAEVTTYREKVAEAFPHLRGVRNTAQHLEDRARGLGAGRNPQPLDLKPIDNGLISAPVGGVLALNCLNGSRYGSTMSDGHYGEVDVSPESMQHLQKILEGVLSSFNWRGAKQHAPNV